MTSAHLSRAGGAATDLGELVRRSERIVLVRAGTSESFEGTDRRVYTRTQLRLLWDLTQTAGKEPEPSFADGEISVIDLASGSVAYVDSSGRRVEVITHDGNSEGFIEGQVALACLRRIADASTRDVLNEFVGEWQAVHGGVRRFGPVRRVIGGALNAQPMREADWQALVDLATEILTLMGVEPGQSRATVLEQVLILRPAEATLVPTASWGRVKEQVR